jgi:hypothetical protein
MLQFSSTKLAQKCTRALTFSPRSVHGVGIEGTCPWMSFLVALASDARPEQTLYIRSVFAYTVTMAFGFPIAERRLFVVTCKRCRRDVPSGREEFPFQSITVECPLCGELRRYLPSELFLGRPDGLVTRQQRAGGVLGSTQVVTDELPVNRPECNGWEINRRQTTHQVNLESVSDLHISIDNVWSGWIGLYCWSWNQSSNRIVRLRPS